METAAIRAAGWVVGRALSPVTDGLLEAWTASSKLGPNVQALKMKLLYAQGMLNNARDRDLRNNPELEQLLLELRNVAYNADDVLDELEYFRIQDQLDGTDDATDVGGIVLNARHTARAVTKCLLGPRGCSCCGRRTRDDDHQQEAAGRGCMDAVTKCLSSGGCSCCGGRTYDDDVADQQEARNPAQPVGKRIPCPSLLWNWCSKAQQREQVVVPAPKSGKRLQSSSPPKNWSSRGHQREHIVPAPKLKLNRVGISKRMKDIVEHLELLCADVSRIFNTTCSSGTVPHNITAENRPETTSRIFEFKLYGRDNLKRSLVDDITQGKYCANSLTIVPILGPGGIGKTTFTQHIYQEVSNHFQVPVWICVSQNFNANRLEQEIVNKLPKNENEKGNASVGESIIQTKFLSRKFLLVLDDMWKCPEDEWKKLLALFMEVGTTGNVIIVTTRFPMVAEMVRTVGCSIRRIERLDDEDCLTFFQECVFGDKQSWGNHENLHGPGRQIVKKLKGFPLAVKTVGRLLRNKLDVDHWRRVLKSKEWELNSGPDDIMPALKLSYNYLSFDLQQCFSHCALFAEDYEFEREELIRFWIGLGLLDNKQSKRMEDVGSDYLDDLIDHGFFQKSENQYTHPRYVLHDLLHELAMSVSANDCLSIHGTDVKTKRGLTSIRHLSISIDDTHVKDRMTFEKFKTDLISTLDKNLNVENLRTLILFGEYHGNFSKTFSYLFRKAKSLRVILLSGTSYDVEELLPDFSQLIHLRYLRIIQNSNDGTNLPNSIPNCYHLMVLDLEKYYCYSSSLGREMINLVKLRHFVAGYSFHTSIFEVGKLKSLQQLGYFKVKRKENGFELKQLGHLPDLQGSLEISGLERVEDVKEAEGAKLENMEHLRRLTLHWQSYKDVKQENVLESLKPPCYLREISIQGHGGASCPSWLGEDLSISNLEFLRLDNVSWEKFPPIGEFCMTNGPGKESINYIKGPMFLKHLKRIELHNLQGLKWWRGNDSSELFPYLEVLIVEECSQLEELPVSRCTSSQAEQWFPKLQEISISNCPNLLSLPPIPWSTINLSKVDIYNLGGDPRICNLGYDNKDARLSIVNKIRGVVDNDSELWSRFSFDNLGKIEKLKITSFPPMRLQHMKMLTSLRTLEISRCTNILCPVEGDSSAQFQIPVESLDINTCNASGKELTQLISYFPKLRSLSLFECSMVTELGVAGKQRTAKHTPLALLSASACKTEDAHGGQEGKQTGGEEIEAVDEGDGLLLVPREMRTLNIDACRNLRLYPGSSTLDDGTEATKEGLQGLHSLTSLGIRWCPELSASSASSAYSPLPASLQSLTLNECTDLTGEGFWTFFPQRPLTKLYVRKSPNFFTWSDTEPSRRLNQQDLHPHHTRSCELETDDIAGVLAQRICARLSPFLTKLVFQGNEDMDRFTEAQEAALKTLTSLQDLEIRSCSKLQSLPAGLSDELPNLKRLEIFNLDSIQSIPKEGLPSSLTELKIQQCAAIQSIPEGSLPNSLQNLEIIHCESIQSLPQGSLPSSLQTLKISNCPGIQSLEGILPSSLQNLEISWCESIRSLPMDGLPDSLRLLDVRGVSEELRRQCRKLKGTIPIVNA